MKICPLFGYMNWFVQAIITSLPWLKSDLSCDYNFMCDIGHTCNKH